ncbi:MAG: dienelactone hydrolase family protein [Acidobacteria bacterium]|nr:dienelactone hydrolase family protein [Acidobacteriota bacterium]
MDQKIIDLYDEFTHGGSTRREFVQRLSMVAGGMPAAIALLQQLENDYKRPARIAESDERINRGVSEYEAALKAAGIRYDSNIYDGKNHAIHNDTSPNRYDAEAAALAWKRTIAFFGKYLE